MMTTKILSIVLAFLMSSLALADSKTGGDNPCTKDLNKYCSDVTPGEGRLAHCMKNHAAELSSGCKTWGEQYKKKHPEVARDISSEKNSGKKNK